MASSDDVGGTRIFAVLTMVSSLPGGGEVKRYRANLISYPGEQAVSRIRVLTDMIAVMPEEVRGGVVLFFSAEPEEVGTGA